MSDLLDVPTIAELGGWSVNYVYVWLRRRGLVPVGVRGTGRERRDLYDGTQVREAIARARGVGA